MTEQEWAKLALEIEATFRGGLDEDREAAMREHFGRVGYEQARRCLARLVRAGQVFVPTPGEMVAALRSVIGDGWALEVALSGLTSEQLAERKTAEFEAARAVRREELARGSIDG